ncbi:MAG TPA: glycosyltransferase [Flavobacterium sp.]|nr:glycosyltransferase [Flavobacterium sp.]
MRIIQIIDSLEVGGAEKMSVNYANALVDKVSFSGLIATRREGYLKELIDKKVNYLFLDRKKRFDIEAVLRLKEYCVTNKVEFVQSHSSSYFIAFMLKLIYPKIKIIWHDHNGLSEFLGKRNTYAVKMASILFKGVIAVNYQLKNWAERDLFCKNVTYLPNFTKFDQDIVHETNLSGIPGKRILCLANLRHQKNHFLLLEIAEKFKSTYPDWTFHLVGKCFEDQYSKDVREMHIQKNLQETVFIYGTRKDTENIINQSDIAILTSNSEGLPVALLEYGLCKKPVVSTSVGEIPLIIENGVNGFTVPVNDKDSFFNILEKLVNDKIFRDKLGENLNKTINENNSEEAIVNRYISWLKTI